MISEPLPDDPEAQPLPDHGDVWYVSYGSNMSASRLAMYLEGGMPAGGKSHEPRCPEQRPAAPERAGRPAGRSVLRR